MIGDMSEIGPRTFTLDSSTLQGMVRAACVLEASARKPGNVHPWASFEDLAFNDFIRSAEAIAPILAHASELGVSQSILEAIRATRRVVSTNTNLGIVLLLAPLAALPINIPLRPLKLRMLLEKLTVDDTVRIYEAIRLAIPGGMGEAAEQDLADTPTLSPLQVLDLAADRDQIARLWCDAFEDLLEFGVPTFVNWTRRTGNWEQAIVGLQLAWLENYGDTLIERKLGTLDSEQAKQRAGEILDAAWPERSLGWDKLNDFDHWLRADGHRRNPGTTADIIAAILFAAMRMGVWQPPEQITLGEIAWGLSDSGSA